MKRALKIFGWTLLGLVLTVVIVASVAVYIVFTPERLTPIARQAAAKYITCEHEIGEVDLTFFSTFPYFGLSVKDVLLVNPKEGAQNDTLLSVPELVASVKLLDAINGDIFVKRFRLNKATANVFIAADGTTNFDVFALPQDTTPKQEDTIPGWQLKSIGWDEDLVIDARTLTFVDNKDTITASLYNTNLVLAGWERDTLQGAKLDLVSEQVNASVKGVEYAKDMKLKLHLPVLCGLSDEGNHLYMEGVELAVNQFGLALDGEVSTPCFASNQYTMDLSLKTGEWQISEVLALVPDQFKAALSDLAVDGKIRLEAAAKGCYADSILPAIQAHLTLDDGEGSYKPLPYTMRDVALDATADVRLTEGEVSNVVIEKLEAKTKQSQIAAKGRIDDLLGNMLLDLTLDLDANLPDFAYFLPEEMTLLGHTQGTAKARLRLDDLTEMRPERGKIEADLRLDGIHYAMDSMVADLPSTHARIQLPNPAPSAPKVNWARIDLTTDQVDFTMAMPLNCQLSTVNCQLEAGNVLSKSPVLYAAVGLQSEQPLTVEMDSIAATIAAPKMTAYAEYNTKDTTVMPVLRATLDCRAFNGNIKDIVASLKASTMEASVSGGRKDKSVPVLRAKLNTSAGDVRIGNELAAKTGVLSLEAGARYKAGEENPLLQWNPRLKVNLKDGELSMPQRLPELVKIPSIEFGYSNREMNIENSRVELGHSDLNLKGNVRNIGRWFRHDTILVGQLDIVSDHCDANQLLDWFSADKGSEEESPSNDQSQVSNVQSQMSNDSVKESDPFLVPTDVDLALNTHIREVEISDQIAKDLRGGLYIKDGKMILDEMGFVCHAAKLQLTALYRTPRRNHIYVGLDYHMIDVNIDELLSMIPNLEELVPMLRSFKGAAQFHLAAETYLNSRYEPKMSTLRGAASLSGKDMVVLDGETFSKISKLLMFNKKTENVIDSINAEITVYKNEIDVYPLCVSMDNYMVALGGRHRTDMTFDYDINVLKPIYLGVHVGGNMDDLQIKLAKCKFAKDFRPHWYQKTDSQSLELRRMIKNSLEKNVRIQ
ncbi:MAG: AsmA family protein [Paludibacteraceae bacterium]|nr:AsmA family protein [Paludibacteraceae bacterium]